MRLLWASYAWDDYVEWQRSDGPTLAKINALLADIRRQPFKGLGKPERLKGNLAGWWSRRITGEHRLVYRVAGAGDARWIEIAQCRYHY